MNRCDYLDPGLAWTGVKDSGRGCTLSTLGYEQLTRPKVLPPADGEAQADLMLPPSRSHPRGRHPAASRHVIPHWRRPACATW